MVTLGHRAHLANSALPAIGQRASSTSCSARAVPVEAPNGRSPKSAGLRPSIAEGQLRSSVVIMPPRRRHRLCRVRPVKRSARASFFGRDPISVPLHPAEPTATPGRCETRMAIEHYSLRPSQLEKKGTNLWPGVLAWTPSRNPKDRARYIVHEAALCREARVDRRCRLKNDMKKRRRYSFVGQTISPTVLSEDPYLTRFASSLQPTRPLGPCHLTTPNPCYRLAGCRVEAL